MENSVDVGDLIQPVRTRVRSGMFSAQHGLFLAVFLAVTLVLAFFVRWLCRRYCPEKCTKCSPKHDESIHSDHQLTTVSSSANSEQTVVQIATAGSLRNSNFDGGRIPSHCGLNSGMQTLYEEDESVSTTPNLSRSNTSPDDLVPSGVVYTIYTFPKTDLTPEMVRSTLLSGHSWVPPAEGTYSPPQCGGSSSVLNLRDDLPPSYDDLFPVKSDSNLIAKSNRNIIPPSQRIIDTAIDVEPAAVHVAK